MRKDRKKRIEYRGHLAEYYESGVEIQVEDIAVTEENLIQLDQLVRETDCYMKDFIENGEGEVCQINYTKITQY